MKTSTLIFVFILAVIIVCSYLYPVLIKYDIILLLMALPVFVIAKVVADAVKKKKEKANNNKP